MCNCRACQDGREIAQQLNDVIKAQQVKIAELKAALAEWAPWGNFDD